MTVYTRYQEVGHWTLKYSYKAKLDEKKPMCEDGKRKSRKWSKIIAVLSASHECNLQNPSYKNALPEQISRS